MTAETKRYRCYWCGAKVYTRDERMPPSGRRGYLCWVSEPAAPRGRVRALLCRACHESLGLSDSWPTSEQRLDEQALSGSSQAVGADEAHAATITWLSRCFGETPDPLD